MSVDFDFQKELFDLLLKLNSFQEDPDLFIHGTYRLVLPEKFQYMTFSVLNLYRHVGWNCRITYVGTSYPRSQGILFFL